MQSRSVHPSCFTLLLLAAGEVLLGDLARAGYEVTSDHEEADAIVVNTCAFVEDAKAESLEVISRQHSSSGWGPA